ncbi:hypothetical protein BG653_06647 [Streptomyces platensis]|uniref:Uncharacterized protein n=1 Tax=Streptomyces platensis TaxID=58346 RepID=A0ABX3XNG8_STRPT|nr:hypothetical protein BG653_06647 [Streptomyces platensis]
MGHVVPPAGDVLLHGVVQDEGLLGQQSDVAAQAVERHPVHGDAVEPDAAGIRVVEPQQQGGERRFAGAAGPGDHHQFPGDRAEREVLEDLGLAAGVVEVHLAGFHRADRAARCREDGGGVRVGDGGAGVEDLQQPLGPGGRLGDRQPQLAEVADRRVEVADEGREGQQLAERHPPRGDLPRAEADDGQDAECLEDLDDLLVQLVEAGAGHRRPQPAAGLAAEPFLFVALPVVGLRQDDVDQPFLDHRGDGAVGRALPAGDLLDPAGETAGGDPEERGQGEGDQGHVPAQPERGTGVEDDAEPGGGRLDQPADHQLLDGVHIAGHPLDQVTAAVALEEVRRQLLEVGEDAGPQPHHEALGRPGGERVAQIPHHPAGDGHAQPQTGRCPESADRALLKSVVGELGEDQDGHGLRERGQDGAQTDQQDPAPVAPGQRPEAPYRFLEPHPPGADRGIRHEPAPQDPVRAGLQGRPRRCPRSGRGEGGRVTVLLRYGGPLSHRRWLRAGLGRRCTALLAPA